MSKIFYICDGKKPGCRKIDCYKSSKITQTTCMYTSDISHALNFKKANQGEDFFEVATSNDMAT